MLRVFECQHWILDTKHVIYIITKKCYIDSNEITLVCSLKRVKNAIKTIL